jgi:hypothetical protein
LHKLCGTPLDHTLTSSNIANRAPQRDDAQKPHAKRMPKPRLRKQPVGKAKKILHRRSQPALSCCKCYNRYNLFSPQQSAVCRAAVTAGHV